MTVRPEAGGIDPEDFALLQQMAEGKAAVAHVDVLWAKATRLVASLGERAFGGDPLVAAVWPDSPEGERPPFIWARIKRAEHTRYATHIGLFLAPGQCNLCIDLEKDLLDAGTAAERLDQVLEFYGRDISRGIAEVGGGELKVWTDADNVVAAAAVPNMNLDRFMAASSDAGHPWPRIGYLFDAAEIAGFGPRWVEETARRAAVLVPIYDAMIRACH